MNKLLCALLLLTQSHFALANGQSDCEANAGSYLTGVVVSAPRFNGARDKIHGVSLSHTRLTIRSDQDGQDYDVAIDNVFAVDYQQNANSIPQSLAAIYEDDHLELCGQLYTRGQLGIHWVHNNCNARGKPNAPNGWIKMIAEDGTVGSNIESSQAYCYLWQQ